MKVFFRNDGEEIFTETDNHFLYLTLDLPPPPLFKDEKQEIIIPQIPLATLFSKFNGKTESEYKELRGSVFRRFKVTFLPEYLILVIKRFTKNTFFREKNPTIVNFPVQEFDFGDIVGSEQKESYNLIANIVHEGPPEPGKGTYRLHVLHAGSSRWFEIQDLHVTDILPQLISLSESYIQVWKKVQAQ
jgi:U4/U6.U5 tri-snRNP-associated protein 2